MVGYFSKEKESASGYNLACILTLPQATPRPPHPPPPPGHEASPSPTPTAAPRPPSVAAMRPEARTRALMLHMLPASSHALVTEPRDHASAYAQGLRVMEIRNSRGCRHA